MSNAEAVARYQKKMREQHPEEWAARRRRYRKAWKYKRSQEDYDRVLAEQGGGCAICGKAPEDNQNGVLVWDHDHDCCPGNESSTCGDCVRGLLCTYCNRQLWQFEDRTYRDTFLNYLRRWGKCEF